MIIMIMIYNTRTVTASNIPVLFINAQSILLSILCCLLWLHSEFIITWKIAIISIDKSN